MKKFRLLSLVVCVSILCMALTGCVGTVTSTKINADGSGNFTFKVGYTKDGLEMLNSMAEDGGTPIDINTLTPFDYNGTTYYGETSEAVSFTSCEDFNKKLIETVNSVDNMNMKEDACTLTQLSDGSFTLKFGGEVDLGSGDASSMASTPEEQQAIEENYASYGYADADTFKKSIDLEEYKDSLLLNKVLDFLVENATITEVAELSTDIAGRTESFKPGRAFNRNILKRTTEKTEYNALKALDKSLKNDESVDNYIDQAI